MARRPRVVIPSFPHHVTQRGNRRQKTFFCVDDYIYDIELLAEFSILAETKIWAYCLMLNPVHLIMVPGHEDGLRTAPGETHRRYTRHVTPLRLPRIPVAGKISLIPDGCLPRTGTWS